MTEPMTDERLREIRAILATAQPTEHEYFDRHSRRIVTDLLAEVERLRTENEKLKVHFRQIHNPPAGDCLFSPDSGFSMYCTCGWHKDAHYCWPSGVSPYGS